MGGVALGDTHADRYFVLFPSTLLILSVSRRMSAFVYEVLEYIKLFTFRIRHIIMK